MFSADASFGEGTVDDQVVRDEKTKVKMTLHAFPSGRELVQRYRWNYGISPDWPLTEEMVMAHWRLEEWLTGELLRSNADERWTIFEAAYTSLYEQLAWLNQATDTANQARPTSAHSIWAGLLGSNPVRVYEVGSGKGTLISHLASLGHRCKATEVTRERGQKHVGTIDGLSWGISDGVHLDRFEPCESYDFVISDNVIEHLHPDDLVDHFRGARMILKNGGKYVFATPHVVFGPWDVSWVFKFTVACGMHLREYDYSTLTRALREAGFRTIRAVDQFSGGEGGRGYLLYLQVMESLFATLPDKKKGRTLIALAKCLRFPKQIMITAER